jgi:hypothetical protein
VNDDLSGARQENPVVSMDENDNFVIVWTDYRNGNSDIYAQIFLSDGTPWKSNFIVNRDTLRAQYEPEADFEGNRIIFTWTTNHVEGRGLNVWANGYEWNGVVGVENSEELKLNKFDISEGYPNPFNMEINFEYNIPANVNNEIEISIYNILGEKIITLLKRKVSPGIHKIKWDGKNSDHLVMPSGIYLLKISSMNKSITKKLALIK